MQRPFLNSRSLARTMYVINCSDTFSRKKSYKRALQKASKEEKESPELLPEYPTDSKMEMETLMKRPEVNLEDTKDADKWKSKVMNMLE